MVAFDILGSPKNSHDALNIQLIMGMHRERRFAIAVRLPN